jgi:hypothetical protein
MGCEGGDTSVERPRAVRIGLLWRGISDSPADGALAWPPDLFAFVDRVFDASETYRFVVSPPPGIGVTVMAGGPTAAEVAVEWWEWLDGRRGGASPAPMLGWWETVEGAREVAVGVLSVGKEWQVTEALLALHAVADEACAGLGDATAAPPGPGCTFRAAARELLSVTGSLSPTQVVANVGLATTTPIPDDPERLRDRGGRSLGRYRRS